MTITSVPFISDAIPTFSESMKKIIEEHKELRLAFKYPLFIGSSYFVSVVLGLQPNEPLLKFQKDVLSVVSEKLGLSISGTVFFPHVSLYYGEGDRNKIATSISQEATITEDTEKLILDGTRELKPSEIWVVKCEGPVEEWGVLEKIEF